MSIVLGRSFRVASAALLVSISLGCGSETPIPPGGQTVHISATADELRLEPSGVGPGDVYIVLDESAYSISFVHRSADPSDPHSPPLPVTDDDIRSMERDGSYQGATHEGLNIPPYGNVTRIGPLVEGKYLFLIDENGDAPGSAELLRLGVLQVRS